VVSNNIQSLLKIETMNENVYLIVGVALLLVRILGNNAEPPMPPPSVPPQTIVTSLMPNPTIWQPQVQDHYLIQMLERERRLRQQSNSWIAILLLILVILLIINK
jgi:hypothetical protein